MENSLTLEDLVAVKSMIEVVSQRGAFHANELKPVGELYEKLSAFLETVTVQQNQHSKISVKTMSLEFCKH